MQAVAKADPRGRVFYLLAVAVGVFFLKKPWEVGALLGLHAALWIAVGLGAARLLRQVVKLWGFTLFILISYALCADDPATDTWTRIHLFAFDLPINTAGAIAGALMIMRLLTVILASQVARAGDGRAIAAGLDKLGVPKIVAASIDAVLALLDTGGGGGGGGGGRGGGGRGRGGGGGGGGGRKHADGEASEEGFFASVRRLGRGDVAPIVRRIDRQIERTEAHLEGQDLGPKGREIARDVAVIAGVSLVMLGIKALKVLPSIPFAPGHKLVILTPLYIVASIKTKSRFGATLTGLTMGTVAFLLGDGRYGIFEILKHITPGLVCDALVPFVMRLRSPGPVVFTLLGGVIGAGRFTTIFFITLAVQPPKIAFAMLIPGFSVHTVFGALSGFVTYQIVKAMRVLPSTPSGSSAMHPLVESKGTKS